MTTTGLGKKSDAELQKEVQDELRWDTRLHTSAIGVGVKDGVVTLTGTVETWAKRQAASDAAHRVSGVLDLANDLEVRAAGAVGRTDADIAGAVRSALVWDAFVPDQHIRSTVTKGVVTLEGEVEYGTEREDAERAIRNLLGVKAVVNRITVRASQIVEVRSAIAKALERRIQRELEDLDIQVRDGRVTVTGSVDSWAEKEAVLGAIRGTRGVREVADHLTFGEF